MCSWGLLTIPPNFLYCGSPRLSLPHDHNPTSLSDSEGRTEMKMSLFVSKATPMRVTHTLYPLAESFTGCGLSVCSYAADPTWRWWTGLSSQVTLGLSSSLTRGLCKWGKPGKGRSKAGTGSPFSPVQRQDLTSPHSGFPGEEQ